MYNCIIGQNCRWRSVRGEMRGLGKVGGDGGWLVGDASVHSYSRDSVFHHWEHWGQSYATVVHILAYWLYSSLLVICIDSTEGKHEFYKSEVFLMVSLLKFCLIEELAHKNLLPQSCLLFQFHFLTRKRKEMNMGVKRERERGKAGKKIEIHPSPYSAHLATSHPCHRLASSSSRRHAASPCTRKTPLPLRPTRKLLPCNIRCHWKHLYLGLRYS